MVLAMAVVALVKGDETEVEVEVDLSGGDFADAGVDDELPEPKHVVDLGGIGVSTHADNHEGMLDWGNMEEATVWEYEDCEDCRRENEEAFEIEMALAGILMFTLILGMMWYMFRSCKEGKGASDADV